VENYTDFNDVQQAYLKLTGLGQKAHFPHMDSPSPGLGMVLAVTLRKRYGTVSRGNVHFGTVTFRNVTLAQLGNLPFLLIFINQNNTRYNSLLNNYKF